VEKVVRKVKQDSNLAHLVTFAQTQHPHSFHFSLRYDMPRQDTLSGREHRGNYNFRLYQC